MLITTNLPTFEYLNEADISERKAQIRAQIRSNYDAWLRIFLFKSGIKKLNSAKFYRNQLDYVHVQRDKKRLLNTLEQLIEQSSLLHRELELLSGDEIYNKKRSHWLLDDNEEIQHNLLNFHEAKSTKRLSLKTTKAKSTETL